MTPARRVTLGPMAHQEHNPIETIVRGAWVEGGRILLCRNRRHGYCFLPGGHIDPGETAAHALAREMREELGVRLEVGRFLGGSESAFMQRHYKTGKPEPHQEINLLFELRRPASSTLDPGSVRSQEDHIEFCWVPIQDVLPGESDVRLLPGSISQLLRFHVEPTDTPTAPGWVTDWHL